VSKCVPAVLESDFPSFQFRGWGELKTEDFTIGGTMVWNAGLLTLGGTLIIFGFTFWLINSTKSPAEPGEVAPKIYGMRKKYFVLLLLLIVLTLFVSLRGLPYFAPGAPVYKVNVEGTMWYWDIAQVEGPRRGSVIEAGKLVEFTITSSDVNHGMGIYNQAGELLTQTQAMPGYPSKLYYTFEQPGTYFVVCMEYCGLAHHAMNTTLQVQ